MSDCQVVWAVYPACLSVTSVWSHTKTQNCQELIIVWWCTAVSDLHCPGIVTGIQFRGEMCCHNFSEHCWQLHATCVWAWTSHVYLFCMETISLSVLRDTLFAFLVNSIHFFPQFKKKNHFFLCNKDIQIDSGFGDTWTFTFSFELWTSVWW